MDLVRAAARVMLTWETDWAVPRILDLVGGAAAGEGVRVSGGGRWRYGEPGPGQMPEGVALRGRSSLCWLRRMVIIH